ncbi:hypothetical protein RUM44_002346 [Polyplax serrata]|uniref:Timeless N-terminal domain-containing protein n=1 Tax=Polyplax serrata TaxID=468196 RepID=A0ABR1AMY4_POLSC
MEGTVQEKASQIKGRVAVISGSLGHLYKGEYLIEPTCLEAVKDLIKLLKKDDVTHVGRRCMGEINVVQNHLIHIIKNCPQEMPDLFRVTLRLLINVTTPALLLYREEIPRDKVNRHYYLSLIGHDQCYKKAFTDIELWNKICCKLTNLFEVEWTERSTDDSIEIERIITLLRNVLHIPGDTEDEMKSDNDTTIHDQILFALRQSQILELLLFVSSNKKEDVYYLSLLEVFSLLLREYNPKVLARCRSEEEKEEKDEDTKALMKALETQKTCQKKYTNTRDFKSTFVMRGLKSASNIDIICHKSLDNLQRLSLAEDKCRVRSRRVRLPAENERMERKSTLSMRQFLKEFCAEFLNSSYQYFMSVVKHLLDSGKSLSRDRTYYFWGLAFFTQFATESNTNVDLIKDTLSAQSFHFIYTSMESALEYMKAEKKERVSWVKRVHTILKAYYSLLESLLWMDCSKSPMVRALSREIKSDVFNVVEYREFTLQLLLRYDSTKFPISYLRDLVQTTHLFIKLLEEFSKQAKLVVQKVVKKRKLKKKKIVQKEPEANLSVENIRQCKWDKVSDEVYDQFYITKEFPEIVPFDGASDTPIDAQKEKAMIKIQKLLYEGKVTEAIGLLRSSRQVWPENDHFGHDGMPPEDETLALEQICLADLGPVEEEKHKSPEQLEEENDSENDADEYDTMITQHDFNILDYKMRLANKKVVESCTVLLKNYKKNSDHVNHCVLKLLYRIAWECSMPALVYQASLFWTLLNIMNEKINYYDEINIFTIHLLRKFRKHAEKNPLVFLELLFWKTHAVALEIQNGYEPYEKKKAEWEKTEGKKNGAKKGKHSRKKAASSDDEISNSATNVDCNIFPEKIERSVNAKTFSSNRRTDLHISDAEKYKNVPFQKNKSCVTEFNNEENETFTTVGSWRNRFGSRLLDSSDEDDALNRRAKINAGARPDVTMVANEDYTYTGSGSSSRNKNGEPGCMSNINDINDVVMEKRGRSWSNESSDGDSAEKISKESNKSKSKRPKFISSDSDSDDFKSSSEILAPLIKKIRRNVIDSDSDLENTEVDNGNK